MTWQPMSLFIVSVYFRHHSEYPPFHICPNPLHWDTGHCWTDTGDVELRWARDTVQQCDEDNDDTTRTQHDDDLTVRCNDDAGKWGNDSVWQWQHVMTLWPGHRVTREPWHWGPSPITHQQWQRPGTMMSPLCTSCLSPYILFTHPVFSIALLFNMPFPLTLPLTLNVVK